MSWFRTAAWQVGMDDLKRRLASSQKDADYWRNEYGNKVAEFNEAKEAAELERSRDLAVIRDLQERNQKLADSKATLERDLADALATIRVTRVSQMEVKNKIVSFVHAVSGHCDQWNF